METLGAGFGEPIRERLQYDARVVIVRALEARQVLFDPDTRRDRERADVVGYTAFLGRDIVRETLVRQAGRLVLLLAQEAQCRGKFATPLIGVHLDVITEDRKSVV